MSQRDVRLRIRQIALPAGRFDEKAFRRQIGERLAHRDAGNRQIVRATVAAAARRAVKEGGR